MLTPWRSPLASRVADAAGEVLVPCAASGLQLGVVGPQVVQRGLQASEAGGEVGVIGGEAGEGVADAAGGRGSAPGAAPPGRRGPRRRLSVGSGGTSRRRDLEAQLELADRDDQAIV
jgi:hypothetical protein